MMTDNKPLVGSKARKWQTKSLAHFPWLVILSLIVSGIATGAAVALLVVADGSPIDSWPLAPTVILSILVSISNARLRYAFSEGSELYWWSKLLSQSGVRLTDLHTMWELSHSTSSLVRFPAKRAPQYHLRLSAFLVVLLAATGPLLQRAVTIESSTRVRSLEATLPIRRQPMWNLTTKPIDVTGAWGALPPYQPEVMELASELNLRQSMTLSHPVCHQNATCTTNVTIAGFGWDCVDKEADPWNITSLPVAKAITTSIWNGGEIKTYACGKTGFHAAPNSSQTLYGTSSTDNYCGFLVSDFQMSFARGPDAENLTYGQLPTFEYATYLRNDQSTPKLSVRQCNFTTSFVELPIRIVNEKTVTLIQPSKDDSGSSRRKSRNDIERIPFGWGTLYTDPIINAFGQIMADMYSGYMLYDVMWASHLSLGMNVRQYINQSSIELRDRNDYYNQFRIPIDGYGFTMLDPFDDFVATLNEVCLRYAIKSIEQSVERLQEFTGYLGQRAGGTTDPGDVRDKVESQMTTSFSEQQRVQLEESLELAVYKFNYIYLVASAGVTYLTVLFTLLLLRQVFSSHGRKFSSSPLEVAKAFDAPLLADVGSNLEVDDIADTLTDVRVRYGEAIANTKSLYEDVDEYEGFSPSFGASTSISDYSSSMLARDETLRLRIDVADRVSKPGRGRSYY